MKDKNVDFRKMNLIRDIRVKHNKGIGFEEFKNIIKIKEQLETTMRDIQEGELTYTEAGEYFYDCLGDRAIDAIDMLLDAVGCAIEKY